MGPHGVLLFANPWTVAHQAPLSMGFFRQKYWSGLPFLSPGVLPDPGIELTSPASPALQADSLPTEPLGKTPRAGEQAVNLSSVDRLDFSCLSSGPIKLVHK